MATIFYGSIQFTICPFSTLVCASLSKVEDRAEVHEWSEIKCEIVSTGNLFPISLFLIVLA